MEKHTLLKLVTFGQPIAEQEAGDLASYFVETEQWHKIYTGEVDIIYGAKGSGKSAIYRLLLSREDQLFDRRIFVIAAESFRGEPVFKELEADPPTSESDLRGLWKLYLLILVARNLREFGISPDTTANVTKPLEEAGLLSTTMSLPKLLRSAVVYVRNLARSRSIEGTLVIDPSTGIPVGLTGKIVLTEPTAENRKAGIVSVDDLLELADSALSQADITFWIALDRLDAAFDETPDLEENALRALFRTYRDLEPYANIHLKIFLRDDIWVRITKKGFREASHITRTVTIDWDESSLLNLLVRRALTNQVLREFYVADEQEILQEASKQVAFFHQIFPERMGEGTGGHSTFNWMLSRVRDGLGQAAPRELIQLVICARDHQVRRFEIGHREPSGATLIDRDSLVEGLKKTSRQRLQQTLYAENPDVRPWVEALKRQNTELRVGMLSRIWGLDIEEAKAVAQRLVEVGFFEFKGTPKDPAYRVPFLYRGALEMNHARRAHQR